VCPSYNERLLLDATHNAMSRHKVAGNDIQLEEPEALNVVIDGHASPDDILDEGRGKQRIYRVLLALFTLAAVSVTLGVSLGLARSDSRPTQPPSSASEFLDGLPSYSLDLAKNDADSPQARALTWLQGDPLYNGSEHSYRLYQRYALAVLYYATNGTDWNGKRGWLSNASECEWYTASDVDICDGSSRLSVLDLHDNGLDGSIPTELELLTDLETMYFEGFALSGKIHSNL
jgi:hypothetical protein